MFFTVQYPIVINSFPDREMTEQDVDVYFTEFQAVLDADQKFILQIELDGLKNPEWAFLKRMVDFLKKNKPISARLLMGTGIVVTTKFRKAAISFILQFYKANSEVKQFDSTESCLSWCMQKAKDCIGGLDSMETNTLNPDLQSTVRDPWFYVIQNYIYSLLDHWSSRLTVGHLDTISTEWYSTLDWNQKHIVLSLIKKEMDVSKASSVVQPHEIHDLISFYNLVNCVEMVWNSEELSMVSSLSKSIPLIPLYIGYCMIHQTPVSLDVSRELVSQIKLSSWQDAAALGAK
jgi:hypothetical protein